MTAMSADFAQPKLYTDLADWWHLLSAVEEYAEEASIYSRVIKQFSPDEPRTLLELGSGGGNNAWHMKAWFDLTLVELSPAMIVQSQRVNPELEHVRGDMRSARLGREFDAVFVHDAVAYMTTPDDLARAVETAHAHCRPGGVALFCPDHIRETFEPETDHGGNDGPDRAIRYLEWTWDPDPTDTTHVADYVYLLRFADGSTRVEHDRHINGLFARETWTRTMQAAGFDVHNMLFEHSQVEPGKHELFVGVKR
jgi:SAM-dependent methyltransferase